jgi:predicted nucleic acid-binding protein
LRRAVLADTGPLYAALDPSDDNHDRSQEDIGRLNSEGFGVAVAYPTLCECYSLVLYKLGIETAHGWLSEVQDRASLTNPSPDDFAEATELLGGYRDQALSIFDAVTAILSRRLELPVWSYDHHFDVMQVEVWRNL